MACKRLSDHTRSTPHRFSNLGDVAQSAEHSVCTRAKSDHSRPSPQYCPSSSVAEHSLGKGEVVSSILTGGSTQVSRW